MHIEVGTDPSTSDCPNNNGDKGASQTDEDVVFVHYCFSCSSKVSGCCSLPGHSFLSSQAANPVYAVNVIDSKETPPTMSWPATLVSDLNVAAANTIMAAAKTQVA